MERSNYLPTVFPWLLAMASIVMGNGSSITFGGSGIHREPVSELTFQTLEGTTMGISEMRDSVVLLNFWGTWCAPCLEEIPELIKLSHRFQADGLRVIGVTLASGSSDDIREFAGERGMDYSLVIGDLNQVKAELHVMGFPMSILIDRKGKVRKQYYGPQSEVEFTKDIVPLLFSTSLD